MIGHPDLDVYWAVPGGGLAMTFRRLEAPEVLGCNDAHHVRVDGCLWGAV